jgi:hypothetical protein
MLRRHVLRGLLAVSSIGVLRRGAGAKDFDDPEPFVRDLYRREVDRHNSRGAIGETEFLDLFTRETRELVRAGRRGAAKIPAGPILNAFFGWGVLPGQPVEFKDAYNFRGPRVLIVVVELAVRGEPRRAYVHAVKQEGHWRISTIAYDAGDDFASYWRKRARQ